MPRGLPPDWSEALLPWLTRPAVPPLEGLVTVDRVRRGMAIYATVPRPPVAQTPHEVVHRQNKLQLRYYAPAPGAADRALLPVVVVPSLINRAWVCDLEPDRSLVAALSAKGHPTYLVDWGSPGPEDRDQDVAHVVLGLLHRALDRACRHARAPSAHVVGYCQGGTLAAMYTALRPHRVASLVALTAPVSFAEAGRFRTFVDPEHVDIEEAMDADGLIPTDLMQAVFRMLDPMGNWARFQAIEAAAHDPARLARVMARERWLEENVPMVGRFAVEFIREAYQRDALVAGTWTLAGEGVDLGAITCPVFVVASERDFIAPRGSCTPLAELVGAEEVRTEVLPSGHIGLVVGSFGPRVFYPLLDGWLREHAAPNRPVA